MTPTRWAEADGTFMVVGNLSVSVADTCFVTCPKTKMKAILQYMEEGWLGKSQNRMQGVIFKYDPDNDDKTRIKDVSDSDVVARVEGCWHEQIYWTKGSKAFDKSVRLALVLPYGGPSDACMQDKRLVVDLQPLTPAAKIIPPENSQLPNESRRHWAPVTEAILSKQWNAATQAKTEIEERQRAKAADRQARGVVWTPRFFTEALTASGVPELTAEGRAAMLGLERGEYGLQPSAETAA